MSNPIIIGLHVTQRSEQVATLQALLTEFGCQIKTRLGLHEVNNNSCSPEGIILLELIGGRTVAESLIQKASAIEGVEAQMMMFGENA
jgi:hypothetical protein